MEEKKSDCRLSGLKRLVGKIGRSKRSQRSPGRSRLAHSRQMRSTVLGLQTNAGNQSVQKIQEQGTDKSWEEGRVGADVAEILTVGEEAVVQREYHVVSGGTGRQRVRTELQ